MMRTVLGLLVLLNVACGSAPPPVSTVTEAEIEAANTPVSTPAAAEGTIARVDLETVVAAGLGRFLNYVGTEPHLEEGTFVGHRITVLRGEVMSESGLQVGDTVVAVNGQAIERPEQAMTVWNALSVASEVRVDFLREGVRQNLRFPVED